jgi:nucleotide-binding universal stress UspA family protein
MNTTEFTEGAEGDTGPALGVVVCGVDSSERSRAVPRHALAIADEGAEVRAVSVWDPVLATDPDEELAPSDLESRKRCELALERASEVSPDISTSLFQGAVIPSLLGSAADYSADLLAVASHGESRAAGVLFGSAATAVLREAPCSVLISRDAPTEFPGRILHAGDGSPDSLDAAWVAARIAGRRGVPVTTISVGAGPERVDAIARSKRVFDLAGVEVEAVEKDGSAHRELVSFAESDGTGLIVIGSKGRTGLASIGSVSERVAHRAPCPVLVTREKSHPSVED